MSPWHNGDMSTPPPLAPRSPLIGLSIVWLAAAFIAVAICLFAPTESRAVWLSIGLGMSVIISFAVQVAVGRAQGFITRMAASVAGALVLMGVISGIFWLIDVVAGPIV